MSIKSKYYPPHVSELYVGFKHQIFNMIEWVDHTLDYEDLISGSAEYGSSIMGMMGCDYVRVKWLSKECIESLGWTYEKTYPGMNEDHFVLHAEHDIYNLDIDYDTHYCRIYWDGEGDVTRFSGIIKNVNELDKLVQQLGIA